MFREFEITKKTPKGPFFVNKAIRSEKEITFEKLGSTTHDLAVFTYENRTRCNARNMTKHSLN